MLSEIPAYIINLRKDVKKREHMDRLCKKYNLNYHFIDAVYGKELSDNEIDEVYNLKDSIKHCRRALTKGEIGCALSHLKIYRYMVENNIQQAIIFEDDIEIKDGFDDVVGSLEILPKDWELVLLGYLPNFKIYKKSQKKINNDFSIVRFANVVFGLHAYLINLKGAKRLLNQLTTIAEPIDHYTGDSKYINLYGVYPEVVGLDVVCAQQSNLALERSQEIKVKLPIYNIVARELFVKPYNNYIKIFTTPRSYKK